MRNKDKRKTGKMRFKRTSKEFSDDMSLIIDWSEMLIEVFEEFIRTHHKVEQETGLLRESLRKIGASPDSRIATGGLKAMRKLLHFFEGYHSFCQVAWNEDLCGNIRLLSSDAERLLCRVQSARKHLQTKVD